MVDTEMARYPLPSKKILTILKKGVVIPAHPLALTQDRKVDELRQRALTRYYITAGAGGLAIGVHTTQFEIHDPRVGLYKTVLELGAKTIKECEKDVGRLIVKVAGLFGSTKQAVSEAIIARDLGYDVGLICLNALKEARLDDLIAHCQKVAEIIPLFGFYLQPAVGGRILRFDFWRRFLEIENVVAIKIAPFNRYYTLDVIRAVIEAERNGDVALYTGNDDNIVNDLLTTFSFRRNGEDHKIRIVGGLLGQWAFWTKRAVELLDRIHAIKDSSQPVPQDLLTLGAEITDANGAIFDVANNFAGCIPGIHEVLRRQGLLKGRWCLDPKNDLSTGQKEEIDRIYVAYPHLNDDEFVSKYLKIWLEDY